MYNYKQKLKEKNIKVKPLEEYKGSKTKILHKCICSNEWMSRPNNILNNQTCSKCYTNNKLTHNDYLEKLIEKNIKVAPLENYVNSQTKILHKCTCSNEWEISPGVILKGVKCYKCKKYNSKKLHIEYINSLLGNNIEIYPLEEYKGSETKILHKCTCGNEWKAKPKSVLRGNKCGCLMNKLSNTKIYIEKLKNKNIEIYPLEEYKGSETKILHKCTCGNEWKAIPNNIMSGQKCKCNIFFNTRERYINRRTILYYVKINNLHKIGITLFDGRRNTESNILKKRFGNDIRNKNINVRILQTKIYNKGEKAFDKEQEILSQYDNKRYMYESTNMNWFSGYTELFSEDIGVQL